MRFFAWLALGSVVAFPKCFSEDKRVKPVEYDNTGKEIPFDGPLSIFSGGWDTQTFEGYILYLIATEKLGLNATFFPPMNEDDMKTLGYGFHWKGEFYDDWALGEYWHSYPNRLIEGKVHIIADLIPSHEDYEPLKNNCTIRDSKVLIDLGMHIAASLTKDNGNLFYQSLKQNDTLLEMMKDKECVKVNGSENCKGQIYASSLSYATTKQVIRHIEVHNLGSRWNLNALGTDELLYEKVEEHKEKGEYGLYAIWSPSVWHGLIPVVPMYFDYNPTGNSDDPSVVNGTSTLPPYQSGICRSKHLDEIRSEIMDAMLYNFNLNRLQLSEMLTKYASNGRELHAAVCEWMKENEAIVDSWVVNANQLEFIEDIEGLNMDLVMVLIFVGFVLAGGTLYGAHYCGILRCLSDVVIGPVTSAIVLFSWKILDVAGSFFMFMEINGADDIDPLYVILFTVFLSLHAITFFLNLYYTIYYMAFLWQHLNTEDGEQIMKTFETGPTTPQNWQFNYDMTEHLWQMSCAGTLSFIFEDIFGTILGAYACVMYKHMINENFIGGFVIQCLETGLSATEPYAIVQYANSIKRLEEHQATFKIQPDQD